MRVQLIIYLFFVSSSLFASDFYLRMHDNSPFTVVFNQSVYKYSCQNFQLQNIIPGEYPIEVYTNCPVSPCQLPIYKGAVKIPSSTMIMGCVDPYNRLNIIQSPAVLLSGAMDPRNSSNRQLLEIFNLNDSLSFIKAKEVISGNGTQDSKIWFLKRCIFYHGITSEKLAETMLLLSFDTGRLELAKSAYWYTFNREVYYKVYDSFLFSSTRRELENHLWSVIMRGY